MELRHLRYFQAVAETLSFSRAAERLRVAQPAVSRRIVALEEEIGCKLFIRTTSRVRLTDAGRHLHAEVGRILAQLSIAVTGAQAIGRGRAGEFNIGSDWRLLFSQMPDAAAAFRSSHPGVSVNFVEIPVHDQIEALSAGRIHLGFVHQALAVPRAGFDYASMLKVDMKIVIPANHRLAGGKFAAMRDLRKETWLKLDEKNHPGYRTIMIQLCHPALFTPKFGRVTGSVDGMLALVALGEGICVLPTSLTGRPHPGLRYLDTDCAPFEFFI